MISIDRLEEMAIEEFETKLNSWKEQVELQSNFIDSLLKATNNSEWLDKTILDDEASEIIEKIELDYVQLDHLKAENEELKNFHINLVGVKECEIRELVKLKQALTEIKQLLEDALDTDKTNAEQSFDNFYKAIKLCEVLDE